MIDRRGFMKSSTLGLLVAGLSPVLLMSGRSAASVSGLTAAEFSAQQGSWFQLREGGTHHVQLIAVDAVPADSELEQFRLVFRGPANDPVPDGVYDALSESGDSYHLFVQPSGSDAVGNLYISSVSVFRPQSPASCAGSV